MLRPRKPAGWPQAKVEYEHEINYDKDASWLRKNLRTTGGYIYFSTGEANHHLYSQLEEDFQRARDENNADIYFVAGPIMSVPENSRYEKKQEGRENLNPIVRLAKEGKVLLYPAEKRVSHTFRVFEDIPIANVLEPYSPGDRPSGSRYFYHWWTEAASWKTRFTEATLWKKSVSNSFLDHFLFLTDKEIVELRKWTSSKKIDINKIDLEACREFWRDYTK